MSQCLVCFPLTVPCHLSAYLVSLLLVSLCVISPSCVFLLFPIPSLLPSTFLVSHCFVSSSHAQGFSLFWFMEDFLSNKAAALSSPFLFPRLFLVAHLIYDLFPEKKAKVELESGLLKFFLNVPNTIRKKLRLGNSFGFLVLIKDSWTGGVAEGQTAGTVITLRSTS